MKQLFFTTLLSGFLLVACSKKDENVIPDCIQNKIEKFEENGIEKLVAVYKYNLNGDDHFWFNTGAVTYDGSEAIYDENCKEVCGYCGFCVKSKCIDDYPSYGSEEWQLVWKK